MKLTYSLDNSISSSSLLTVLDYLLGNHIQIILCTITNSRIPRWSEFHTNSIFIFPESNKVFQGSQDVPIEEKCVNRLYGLRLDGCCS